MANASTRILCISLLATLLLFLTTVGDASVTWRRVTNSTTIPELTAVTVPSPTSTTKSPVTWKRSTIVRRSTAAVERTEHDATEVESDEILEASSRHDDYMAEEEIENDPEVKPLVPGSRPGFWFDSKRRRKPSSLLRPGDRRNSLFPNRSSTTTTPAPTTITVTPLTVIPRTPPTVTTSNTRNTNTRNFGRNRSTKSPITFRRRLKTTKTPSQSSTMELPERQKNGLGDSDNLTHDDDEDMNDKEMKQSENKAHEDSDLRPKYPSASIIRRPYNGTRLSWKRQNSRATAIPQLTLTTASDTLSTTTNNENFRRKSTRFPKTRTRSRIITSPTPDVTGKTQIAVSSSTTTDDIKRNKKAKANHPAVEVEDVSKSKNIQNFKIEDNEKEVENEEEVNGDLRKYSPGGSKLKLRTTVEPYIITRDYGRVVTEELELKDKSSDRVATADSESKKDKKRLRPKVTETTTTTTTSSPSTTAETQNVELEHYTSAEFSAEDVEEHKFTFTTVKPTPSPEIKKNVEKLQEDPAYYPVTKLSTTVSPISRPTMPPADPNSGAYVVWSLGQGGSGWSYQKQGGQVKWSAQNSEAENDRWSVVSKDEAESIDAGLSHQWLPIRNSSIPGHPKSEKIASMVKHNENNMQSARVKNNGERSSSYINYFPKLPYNNETSLNIKTVPSVSVHLPQAQNISNMQFPPPSQHSTSIPISGVKLSDSNNVGSKESEAFVRDSDAVPFASQTPMPFSPTLEDKYNEQIEGILNQYPIVPNYPYVAEIRDTYNNVPNVATNPPTNVFEVQEYVTEAVADNRERESTTPIPFSQAQWFSQEQHINPYPSAYPQTENLSPYGKLTSDGLSNDERVYNQASPVQISHHNYFSNIPPELAKAVVDEKKWHVVGVGGDDGWSLLNEDGVLEWKIHNVDGKWKVTSAEQLVKMIEPQQATPTVNDEKISSNNTELNSQPKAESPKVWTLEDDYLKWRAVSAERTNSDDESEVTSSQESDYDSHEYQDYYEGNDYYSNVSPGTGFNPNEDLGNRPVWGNGEYTITQDFPKEDYPQFAGNIQLANSKEDAIEAWKSLVIQQGHWKFPDAMSDIHETHPPEMPKYSQNDRNAEIIQSQAPTFGHGSDRSWQVKETHEATKKYNAKSTGNRFENYGVDLPGDAQSPVQHKDQKNLESMTKDESQLNGQDQSEGTGRYEEVRQKTYKRINEKLSEPRLRIRHKDYSKLDSLINKLETIQKEAKGKAVVDLAELLKQIKARRNATYANLPRSRNENIKQGYRNIERNTNVKDHEKYIDRNANIKHDHRNVETNTNTKHDQKNIEKNLNINQDQRNIERNANIKYDQRNIERNLNIKHDQRNIENHNKLLTTQNQNNINNPSPVLISSPVINLENLDVQNYNRNAFDSDGINRNSLNANNKNKENFRYANRDSNHRIRHFNQSSRTNRKKTSERTQNHRIRESNEQIDSQKIRYSPARPTEQYSRESDTSGERDHRNDRYIVPQNEVSSYSRQTGYVQKSAKSYTSSSEFIDLRGEKDINQTNIYNVPQNKVSSYSMQTGPLQKSAKSDSSNSEQKFADLREVKDIHQTNRYNVPQNKVSTYSRQTGPLQKSAKSDTSSSGKLFADQKGGKEINQKNSYNVRQNKMSSHSKENEPVPKPAKKDFSSSEEIFVDLRGEKETRVPHKRKRKLRIGTRRPNPIAPIVLKGETEVVEEGGSRKNRRIIVIDYAGTPKKDSSVDKKDLELIIRNVKHRRSESLEN